MGVGGTMKDIQGKRMRVFFVEMDDEDRERVVSALVEHVEINHDPEYADIHSGYSDFPVSRFLTSENVTIKAKVVPFEDGTYFRIENFLEEDTEDED